MKKLMMALVAVAFGCAAQAAVVNWSTTAIKQISDKDGTQGGANCADPYTAILTIIGDGGVEVVSEMANGWSLGKVKATTIDSSKLSLSPASGDPQTYQYTLVISGTVSDNTKNYADAIGTEATLIYEGTLTMGAQGETGLTITPSTAKWTYASVPEPTSGLLLLLGVAGMALRRRRA